MEWWQTVLVTLYALYSLLATRHGIQNGINRANVFGLTPWLYPLGIFVCGDAVIIGIFGLALSLFILAINNWWIGVTLWSFYWIVRSLGEMIYWLNQQFSPIERNAPPSLRGYHWFPNDSIWFIYQVSWQCLAVLFLGLAAWSLKHW